MNKLLQDLWKKLPKPLRNRYFLTLTLFFFFMIFIDRHDFITQFKLQRTVNKLHEDREFYQGKINEAERQRLDMDVNKERFARERYFMQKNDEDVFIIVDEEEEEE